MNWYFQGIQKLTLIGYGDFIGKVFLVGASVFLINDPYDLWIFFAAQIIIGVTLQLIYIKHARLKISMGDLNLPAFRLVAGNSGQIGLLYIIGTVIGAIQPLLLGRLALPVEAGKFGASEKIARALYSVAQPIRFAFFPKIAKSLTKNDAINSNLIKSTLIMVALSILASSLIYLYPAELLSIIFHDKFTVANDVLRILAVLPILTAIREGYITQYLLATNREMLLTKILCQSFLFAALFLYMFLF
jgi:O-antigen/teichoic acid export membrane protein